MSVSVNTFVVYDRVFTNEKLNSAVSVKFLFLIGNKGDISFPCIVCVNYKNIYKGFIFT